MSACESCEEFEVAARSGRYRICFGVGSLQRLVSLLDAEPHSRLIIVADRRVWNLHGQRVQVALEPERGPVGVIELPPGEEAKRFSVLRATLEGFAERGLDRDTFLLALGGGAACDLAGLAAALWMRAIPWGILPTTVLAQVDASIGGKTAIDLEAGKNLVGAFHAPRFVLSDPAFLATLPERELRSGLAEILKAALIADSALFARLESRSSWAGEKALPEPEMIRAAIRIKAEFVGRDELERGPRRVLNLGHTLGHGLERASGWTLRHGEAVAIGILAACDLARSRGWLATGERERVRGLLERIGLPTTPPAGLEVEVVMRAISLDKKRRGGCLTCVLPKGLGAVRIVEDLDECELREWLRGACGS